MGTIQEELTENILIEMSTSEPVLDHEEEHVEKAVPENKLLLGNLVEGFCLLKTAFNFLYDIGIFMRTLLFMRHQY